MPVAVKPVDDQQRIEKAKICLEVTNDFSQSFDELVSLAANICQTKMAVISIVLGETQFFKSKLGIEACETNRDVSFCSHTILEEESLIVPDATLDGRFSDNPAVTLESGIRFYAGFILKLSTGEKIGTLCVFDVVRKILSPDQISALRILAKQVVSQFELRLQAAILVDAKDKIRSSELKNEIQKKSELRFKSIVEQSPFPSFLVNREGRITKVNKAWQLLWSVSDEWVEGFQQNYSLHTDLQIENLGAGPFITDAFKGKNVVIPPGLYRPEPGKLLLKQKWIKIYMNPIMNEDGGLSEVLLIFLDLTEQKNAEEAVGTKQRELQSILDNSSSVIYLKDLTGKYLLINSEFEKVFNVSSEALIGKTDYHLFPSEFADIYRENDLEVLRTNTPMRKEEIATQSNKVFTYLSAKFPVHDEEGKIRAVGGISTDITQMRAAEVAKLELEIREKSALETSKLKSTFLANMSHEIRTPINGVIGMTEILLDTELDAEQRDYANTIRRSGETLLTIINDILDFSKIDAGKLDFETLDFDLWEVIEDSKKTMSFAAEKRGLQFQILLSPELPKRLIGDPGRLKQVFLNLLSNAIKFTAKGSVTLRGFPINNSPDYCELRFEVKDSGIGIPSETVSKLFQPFSQADASTQRKFGGTGLGLSICKKLLESWEGDIGVESVVGEGSTFWFEFKMQKSLEVLPLVETKRKELAGSSRKMRILVVEDNSVNQTIALKMLQKMGYNVDVAANGFEALSAVQLAPYDIVLMDCQMPECDGYEATRLIRALDTEVKNIVILAMTANAMSGDAEICLAAGMNGYLTKPISKDKLHGVLKEWLEKAEGIQ